MKKLSYLRTHFITLGVVQFKEILGKNISIYYLLIIYNELKGVRIDNKNIFKIE